MPRSMEITTPLPGVDTLLFHRLHGKESLGRLSSYSVDLLSDADTFIKFDDILGQNVTVKVELHDGSTRYFNGFVSRFMAGGRIGRYLSYRAEVVPWLWFLTRTADCRIFQNKTVPQILEEVFRDHEGLGGVKLALTGSYEPWTYCVQYRETDFNFASRLMEHEGIYYYFQHTDGNHTMVITDSVDLAEPFPGYDIIDYFSPEAAVRPETEHISSWVSEREIQPGVFSLDDFDFERPSLDLRLERPISRNHKLSNYEWFDYPGFFTQKKVGEQLAEVRGEEFGTQFDRRAGVASARGISVGSSFTLKGFRQREDQDEKHLVVSAFYDITYSDYEAMPDHGGSEFSCRFEAIPVSQQFRPQRITPKPFVQGPQTAIVVGPGGEEIHTDKHGRVKVQFHWDSRGKKDDNSSCWIRVSHPWAGKNWGAVAIPRIGQEVVVDFLEGDPDQPLITGRVYNAESVPPYALPANKTQSGLLSRSSPGGSGDTANELMFEDKKGSELIYLRAEKDYTATVENDEVRWVGHDKWIEVDNDETTFIKGNRTEEVDKDETITIHMNRTEVVDKDETITIHKNRYETVDLDETVNIKGGRTHSVSKSESLNVTMQRSHTVGINETITVGAAQEVTVGGAQAVSVGALQTVTVGGTQTTSVGGARSVTVGGNQSLTVAKNLTINVTGDEARKVNGKRNTKVVKDDALEVEKKLTIIVGDAIMLKTGDASIEMKKNGNIIIKGKDITLEGSGKINVKASSDLVLKGSKIAGN